MHVAKHRGHRRQETRHRPARHEVTLEGRFVGHRDGYGFVTDIPDSEDVFIPAKFVGGVLDGDRVRATQGPPRGGRSGPGRIIEILGRRDPIVRGRVQRDGPDYWMEPINRRLPDIFLEPDEQTLAIADGDFVEAEITQFPEDGSIAPYGRVTRIVDDALTPDGLVTLVLDDMGLPTGFSAATMAEMAALPDGIPSAALKEREDLTALPFVTIDGPDARDFDDAVCLQPAPRGQVRLLVAIADVAAYVLPGSAVDADAQRKGTSVYFPHKAEPMLPDRLSNNLCSLMPKVRRLTLTCDMTLDREHGELRDYRIYASIIRSQARLTYGQVQDCFERGAGADLPQGTPTAMLAEMRELATAMRKRREKRGALNFVFPEARFTVGEDGEAVDVRKAFPTEATRLIEQFMLEANETVAAHCVELEIPVLHRVHDPPPQRDRETLVNDLGNFGLRVRHVAVDDPRWINEMLRKAEDHADREQIELILLKSMSQACYRAADDGHFGLAAPHYTHFTSPIRRYPDLIVHRALHAWLGGTSPQRITLPRGAGEDYSAKERLAADAESRVSRMFRAMVMEPHVGELFDVLVTGVSRFGANVTLDQPYVEGNVPLDHLYDDHYTYDPHRNVLQGKKRTNRIKPGMPLRVQLVQSDRLTGRIEFIQAKPHRERRKKPI